MAPYTAAAVAAIAFERPAVAVDGNVERVTARLFDVREPLPDARPDLRRLAGLLAPDARPGDWAQASMDLGAVICRPKAPLCGRCPVAAFCAGRAAGAPERLPAKRAKAERPRRFGTAYVALKEGRVALVRRPPRGLLGGMLALPTSAWGARPDTGNKAAEGAPAPGAWRSVGEVEHVFTSLRPDPAGREGGAHTREVPDAVWTPVAQASAGLPTVFRKALEAGLGRLA